MLKTKSKCGCGIPSFSDRVDLYADTSTDDNPAEVFTESSAGLPCNIMTTDGDETYRGQQLTALISHVVTMPYRSGITADMQLLVSGGIYDARILNIESVRPIRPDTNRIPFLEIYCRELET